MRPRDENGRPGQGAPISSNVQNLDACNGTPRGRQTPAWHAVADVRVVVGRGGVPRLLLLVARCPGCYRPHMHLARVPFTATIRKAGCGTRYTVHALSDEAVA